MLLGYDKLPTAQISCPRDHTWTGLPSWMDCVPCQRPRLQRADRCPEKLRRKTVGLIFPLTKTWGFHVVWLFFNESDWDIHIWVWTLLHFEQTTNPQFVFSPLKTLFVLKPRWCTWAQPPTATIAMAQPSTETPALRFESGAPAPSPPSDPELFIHTQKATLIWVFPKLEVTPKWMVYNGKPY